MSRLQHAITRATARVRDFEHALEAALRVVCRAAGWPYAEAWARPGRKLLCVASWTSKPRRYRAVRRAAAQKRAPSLPARCWRSRRLEWIDLEDAGFDRRVPAREAGATGALAVPLLVGGRPLAVLVFVVEERGLRWREAVAAALTAVSGVLERKRVESELRARVEQQEAVATLGRRLLEIHDEEMLLRETVDVVRRTLDVELCKVLELQPDGSLLLRAGTGWREGLVGTARLAAGSQPAYTLEANEPVVVEDVAQDQRFAEPLLHSHGAVSGLTVVVPGISSPYGVLGAHAKRPRLFTKDDCHFMQAAAHQLGAALNRTRAEAARREGESQVRAILESAAEGVLTIDAEGAVLSFSPAAERIFGYTEAEVRGRPASDLISGGPNERADALTELAKAAAPRDIVARRKDGTTFPISWSGSTISLEGRRVHVAVIHDLSTLRSAEQELRQERSFVTAVLETAGMLVVVLDAKLRVVHWNRAAQVATGWPPEEIVGGTLWPRVLAPGETEQVRGVYTALRRSRKPGRHESYVVTRDGEQRYVAWNDRVVTGPDGEVRFIISAGLDITERKSAEEELARYRRHLESLVVERTAELEQSHERLRLAERLASVGTLAAGLGHDMGNLLLPILCRLDAIETQPLPEKLGENLRAIRHSAEYLRQLSQGLRLFALDPEDPEASGGETDVEDWIGKVGPLLAKTLPRHVELETDIAPNLPAVAVPAHRLTQAVFHLVTNAGEATPLEGKVRLWAARDGNGKLLVGVTDAGVGMTRDVRRRALDPFFTTKTRGLSTGLGLSLVHAVARAAGGSVEIESSAGEGTSVVMSLPAVKEGLKPGGPDAIVAAISVDDRRLAAYASLLLSTAGIEIRHAPTGEPGEADLWLTEPTPAAETAAAAFLDADPQRRVVVLRGSPEGWRHPGCLVVRPEEGLEGLRRALGKLVREIPGDRER